LLAHGRWFSPGTPASSTTKTGLHDIAEKLLKVALNTNKKIKFEKLIVQNLNMKWTIDAIATTGTRIPDPLFPHLVPPAIMVGIYVWKYIFGPFIHILQHFVLQLSRSTNFCFYVQLPYYLYIHTCIVIRQLDLETKVSRTREL
jgi:hypothetical protein